MSTRAPAPARPSSSQRGQRLDSLRNPLPRPPPRTHKPRPDRCINPDCEEPTRLEVEDGKLVCESCGTVAEDSVDLVTDVSFGLESGRAVLHGQHVAADASHARGAETLRGGLSSLEKSISDGKRYIDMVTHALHITEGPKKAAELFYRLAANANFIQGRRIRAVAAVCLYVGCRSQRDNHNLHMLIDFADVLNIDVFHLGSIYQDFLKEISINGAGYWVQPINPEHLILRFAARLEFEGKTMRVANDAVRIVQRMDRDWMTPGRRPAGVCGAALIIAARMNNFRRTPREMMYVVKVNDMTIIKRLEEFKDLESSGLTVEDFRSMWLEGAADPPAFSQSKNGQNKRGRKRKEVVFDDDGDDLGDQPNPADMIPPDLLDPPQQIEKSPSPRTRRGTQTEKPRASKRVRDAKQQASATSVPVDPALQSPEGGLQTRTRRQSAQERSAVNTRSRTSRIMNDQTNEDDFDATAGADIVSTASANALEPPRQQQPALAPPARKKRGRPRKVAANEDNADSAEITAALADPFERGTGPATWQAVVDVATGAESEGPVSAQRREVPNSEIVTEEEFADDPEVNNCLLSPEEVEIKTRIWTSVNFDWLRAKAAKAYQHELEVAAGTYRPKKVRIRRRRRIGDLSTYAGDLGPDWEKRIEESGGLADSAAESVRMMLENRMYGRGKALSSKINYDKIRELYTPSSNATRRTSEAGADSPGSGGYSSASRPVMTATMIDQTQADEESASSTGSVSEEQVEEGLGLSGTTIQGSTPLTPDQLPRAAETGAAAADPQSTLVDEGHGNENDKDAEEDEDDEDDDEGEEGEEGEESGWKSGQFDNSYEGVGGEDYD